MNKEAENTLRTYSTESQFYKQQKEFLFNVNDLEKMLVSIKNKSDKIETTLPQFRVQQPYLVNSFEELGIPILRFENDVFIK